MTYIKRFAFWPLLALVCMVAVSATTDPHDGTTLGTFAGFLLSIPLAYVIDRRRQAHVR